MCPAPSCATPANPARHQRHRPKETTLYRIVQSHLNPFLAFVDTQTGGSGLPTFVTDECDAFLASGILADLPVGSAKRRMRWAQLLKRVFDIDIERCPHCGGQLKLIVAIEDAAAIARILTHLGLAAQPPPRAPARRVDLFQAASPVKPDWTLTELGEVCGRRSGKRSDGVGFRRAACGNCRQG